jgi:hypothetical protein
VIVTRLLFCCPCPSWHAARSDVQTWSCSETFLFMSCIFYEMNSSENNSERLHTQTAKVVPQEKIAFISFSYAKTWLQRVFSHASSVSLPSFLCKFNRDTRLDTCRKNMHMGFSNHRSQKQRNQQFDNVDVHGYVARARVRRTCLPVLGLDLALPFLLVNFRILRTCHNQKHC